MPVRRRRRTRPGQAARDGPPRGEARRSGAGDQRQSARRGSGCDRERNRARHSRDGQPPLFDRARPRGSHRQRDPGGQTRRHRAAGRQGSRNLSGVQRGAPAVQRRRACGARADVMERQMIDAATVAQAISARLEGGNAWFDGVSIDSRVVRPGELFVAIKGERFDGHEFVAQAFSRGAAAAIVAADHAAGLAASAAGGRSLLAVDDPLQSLASLAAFWRRRFTLPVVAIVGSNGKTTVKEMTAAILRAANGVDRVLATAGNLNNHIGLPLMVLRLRPMHLVAVFEIGMNHVGETAQPTIAVLNNAQREHQEFMKSVADVAAEHATILGTLQPRGIAVINADDDYAPFWNEVVARRNAEGASITVRDFGLRAPATVIGRVRSQSWGSLVDVAAPEGSVSVDLKLPGRHNVVNALGAIAAATAAGASLDAVAQGLAEFRPIAGRLQA